MTDTRSNRHFVVGIIILLVGTVLLLDQLGFTSIARLWPLILIYFGVNMLRKSCNTVGFFWGGFLTLLGIVFQLQELGISRVRFETVWPVFLICLGVLLVLRRYESRRAPPYVPPPAPPPGPPGPTTPGNEPPVAGAPQNVPGNAAEPGTAPGPSSSGSQQAQAPPQSPPQGQPNYYGPAWDYSQGWRHERSWQKFQRRMDRMSERMNRRWGPQSNWQGQANWQTNSGWSSNTNWYESTEPRLDDVNVFWGGRRRIVSKNFLGGDIVAIFGGFEVDLTQADFPGNEIHIEIVTIFGGGEIRIPGNWDVVVDSVGIFGGAHDRTLHPQPQAAPGAPAIKRLIIKGVSIFGGIGVKN